MRKGQIKPYSKEDINLDKEAMVPTGKQDVRAACQI